MTLRERCASCGQPAAVKAAHGWLAIFWLLHVPVALIAYLAMPRDAFIGASLLYTVIASQWANVATHFTGWVAGRIEVKQEGGEA